MIGIFKSRKFWLVAAVVAMVGMSCLLATNSIADDQAIRQVEEKIQRSVKDDRLYEICKEDLEKQDFEITQCGMYLEGFRTSFSISLIYILSVYYEGSDSETINTIAEIVGSSCKSGGGSTKKAAKDFITFIDNENKKRKKPMPSEDAVAFFWDYFVGCGNPVPALEKLHK